MDVVRVRISDGSPEGANSAYLFPHRGLVVDPGPPGDAAWETLQDGISRAGIDLTDVDDVFVTHWHVDHAGLASRLAEAADATIHMHTDDAPLVGDYASERERRLDRDAERLRNWGVPDVLVQQLREGDSPSPLPDAYQVESRRDGGRVAGMEILHSPGHTLGHAGLADPHGGHLFAGDAILPTYTPNVGGGDTRMDDPLSAYLDTLDRISGLGWTADETDSAAVTIHPGHGSTVEFPARLEAIRRHHVERSFRALEIIRAEGVATPWDVATELFGEMRGVHAKMGAGEAAAHLARLGREERVAVVGEDPRRYVSVDAGQGPSDR